MIILTGAPGAPGGPKIAPPLCKEFWFFFCCDYIFYNMGQKQQAQDLSLKYDYSGSVTAPRIQKTTMTFSEVIYLWLVQAAHPVALQCNQE